MKPSGMPPINKLYPWRALKTPFVQNMPSFLGLMTMLIVLRTLGGAGEREGQCQVRFRWSKENQIKIMNDTPGTLRFPGGANECPWS